VLDESLGDQVKITVIATGFREAPGRRRRAAMEASPIQTSSKSNHTWDISMPGPVMQEGARGPADDLDVPTFMRRKREEAS